MRHAALRHHCHAIGCTRVTPPKLLFCGACWKRTPRNLQRLIWRTYTPGQETRKDPSPLYLVAQAHVVADLAVRTGTWTPDRATEHVMSALERHIEALTVADISTLAAYDAPAFGLLLETARQLEAQRRSP